MLSEGKKWLARGGLVALGVATTVGACTVDERKVTLAPGEAEVLPVGAAGGVASVSGPALGAANGQGSDTRESLPDYENVDVSTPASVSGRSGSCDDESDACAPLPLCDEGDEACESTCPGCLIDAECVGPDTVNASNPCQICDPALDPLGWSNNDGISCDDESFCTTDDGCSAGRCAGTPRNCEDGVACNGVSTCNEESDSCSADVNQCPNGGVCDVASGTCVNTCSGCLIAGVCLSSGAEEAGNPCRACDPARSTTAYSAAVGRSCGAAPSACSQQDTCDAQGVCRANDLPAGAACGNSSSSTCDQSDACDGSGVCQARPALNDSMCDDGQFCTVGDSCQGGRCVPTGNRNCGANQSCNEATNQCQCQGCVVGNTCIAVGGNCGSAATECSGQDTCSAQGTCAPNHFANNTACGDRTSSACDQPDACDGNGVCQARRAAAGANCGSPASECSGQDTCNAQGACVPNHLANNTACGSRTSSACDQPDACDGNGVCQARRATAGANCGSPASECSGQDTCNAQGTCVPNHLANNTACGSRTSSACDQPDLCDGNGTCQTRRVANDVTCDDGQFCTSGDRCREGICAPTGDRNCGANRTCSVDQCVCPNNRTLNCTSPAGGSPNCSTWGFETATATDTEGWGYDLATPGTARHAGVGALTSSTAVALSGNRSLDIRFVGAGVGSGGAPLGPLEVFIRVPLCSGNTSISLAGRRLQALVRFVTDPGTAALTTGQGHAVSLYTQASQFANLGGDFSVDPGGNGEGGAVAVDVDLSNQFSSTNAVTHIGFRFLVTSAWQGRIFVDDVRL